MSAPSPAATHPVLLVRAAGGVDRDAEVLAARSVPLVQDPYLVTGTCRDPDAPRRAERVAALLRDEADVLLLTSRTAVRALEDLLGAEVVRAAVSAGVARGLRGAAVGPSTAQLLREIGIEEVVVPAEATSRGLLATLRAEAAAAEGASPEGRGPRAVLPCGAQAMKGLGEGLRADGWQVEEVVLYTTEQVETAPPTVADLAAGRFGAVVVRSPTAVRAVAAWVPRLPAGTTLVCGGPTTAAAARDIFDARVVVSDGPTPEAVADAVVRVLAGAAPQEPPPAPGTDEGEEHGTLGATETERP
ncbi:MAG: uroporphyrinogen-III synthase [Nitriliruptoraceae bacterium]